MAGMTLERLLNGKLASHKQLDALHHPPRIQPWNFFQNMWSDFQYMWELIFEHHRLPQTAS
jgi:hypothetical protein